MPRDGSGNYTLPSGNPVVTNTLIESAWANTTMSDVAVQLNNVLTRDGVLGPISPFKIVDGAVATPGLGFNSEPGLGWFRFSTATLRTSAVNATTSELAASGANQTTLSLFPRLVGPPQSSRLILSGQPAGTANRSDLVIEAFNDKVTFASVPNGTDTIRSITYSALDHTFVAANPLYYAKISNPSAAGIRLTLNKDVAAASSADILGSRGGSPRWLLTMVNATAESGSNAGSDFQLDRYSDAGALLGQTLLFNRANGDTTHKGRDHSFWGRTFYVYDSTGVNFNFRVDPTTTGGSITSSGAWDHNASGGTNYFWAHTPAYFSQNAEFQSAGSGFLIQRGTPGMGWNGNTTEGSFKVMWLFNSDNGGNTFGTSIYGKLYYQSGVSGFYRTQVIAQSFDMLNTGTGQSSGGWVATSDRRVKKDITPIENALAKVRTLSGNTYFKMDMAGLDGVAPRKAGYIAQEIQAVLPEAVTVADDEIGTLSVDHNGVIGLLIEALKETNARIDQIVSQA